MSQVHYTIVGSSETSSVATFRDSFFHNHCLFSCLCIPACAQYLIYLHYLSLLCTNLGSHCHIYNLFFDFQIESRWIWTSFYNVYLDFDLECFSQRTSCSGVKMSTTKLRWTWNDCNDTDVSEIKPVPQTEYVQIPETGLHTLVTHIRKWKSLWDILLILPKYKYSI